eukprot:3557093-Rhodomonas_salina.1
MLCAQYAATPYPLRTPGQLSQLKVGPFSGYPGTRVQRVEKTSHTFVCHSAVRTNRRTVPRTGVPGELLLGVFGLRSTWLRKP